MYDTNAIIDTKTMDFGDGCEKDTKTRMAHAIMNNAAAVLSWLSDVWMA